MTAFDIHRDRRKRLAEAIGDTVVTSQKLAVMFGVSERTIYRDVVALRSEGRRILSQAGVGYVMRKAEARHAD